MKFLQTSVIVGSLNVCQIFPMQVLFSRVRQAMSHSDRLAEFRREVSQKRLGNTAGYSHGKSGSPGQAPRGMSKALRARFAGANESNNSQMGVRHGLFIQGLFLGLPFASTEDMLLLSILIHFMFCLESPLSFENSIHTIPKVNADFVIYNYNNVKFRN